MTRLTDEERKDLKALLNPGSAKREAKSPQSEGDIKGSARSVEKEVQSTAPRRDIIYVDWEDPLVQEAFFLGECDVR